MKRLNLLTEARVAVQRTRRLRTRRITVAAAASMMLFAWAMFARTHIARLDREIAGAREEVRRLSRDSDETMQLADSLHRITRQIEELESIRTPVAPSSVLAMLSRRLSGDLALRRLELDIPEPRAMSAAGPLPPIRMLVSGLAPDPLAAARLVSALSEEPALRNIRLAGSQQSAAQSEKLDQFSLALEIPLAHRELHAGHSERLP